MAASVWMKSWMLRSLASGSARRPALGADDARGDGERQVLAERIADGQHPLADPRGVAVAQRRGSEVVGVDLEHGQVGARIGADDLGLELTPVEQPDRHLVGAVHDVVVGQDVAVLGDDEARARALPEIRAPLARGIRGKNCSNPGGTCICGRPRGRSVLPDLMNTTLGLTCSATDAKASLRLARAAAPAGGAVLAVADTDGVAGCCGG